MAPPATSPEFAAPYKSDNISGDKGPHLLRSDGLGCAGEPDGARLGQSGAFQANLLSRASFDEPHARGSRPEGNLCD